MASLVSSHQNVGLDLGDVGEVDLLPAEVLVDLKKREGFAASQGSNATVVLDTTLTPELIAEGLVRDFIRGVQDARKSAGYAIEDHIAVGYDAPDAVANAIKTHADYVKTETLAVNLAELGSLAGNAVYQNDWHRDELTVGKDLVSIVIYRVAPKSIGTA